MVICLDSICCIVQEPDNIPILRGLESYCEMDESNYSYHRSWPNVAGTITTGSRAGPAGGHASSYSRAGAAGTMLAPIVSQMTVSADRSAEAAFPAGQTCRTGLPGL